MEIQEELKQRQICTSGIYKDVERITKSNRLIKNRIAKLEEVGLIVEKKAMGSGGTLQVKQLDNIVYMQISYGWSKHNYAYAVEIGSINSEKFLPIKSK